MSQRMNYHAASPAGMKALGAVYGYVRQSGLPSRLVDLVFLRVSQINGCAYCIALITRPRLNANDVDTMPRLCGNEPVFMTQHTRQPRLGCDDVCARLQASVRRDERIDSSSGARRTTGASIGIAYRPVGRSSHRLMMPDANHHASAETHERPVRSRAYPRARR